MNDEDMILFNNLQEEMFWLALTPEEDKTVAMMREFAAMMRIWADLIDKAADEREEIENG